MANNPVYRKRASGVTRIVRDNYGKKGDWYALCKEIKKRDGHKCVFCGKPEDPKGGIYHDVHHVLALSKGGTNARSNLATTCDSCHEKRPGHSHMKHQHAEKKKSLPAKPVVAARPANKFSNWRK